MEKVWVIYVPSQHRLFRESLLASCVSRRDWRAEGRRARVASIGAAEALCWAVDLRCTPLSRHQPHLTSETMDAGVHVDATRGREVRTRLGVFSGFRNFIAVCLSVCLRAVDFSFHIYYGDGEVPINVHTHWC